MTAALPSADEIIRLYTSGEFLTTLDSHFGVGGRDQDPFLKCCVELHNNGKIDLTSLTRQSAFANLAGHSFWIAQSFYCDAIPRLVCDASALMECCAALIEKAGADLAANQPNAAFRAWCQNNPNQCRDVIQDARSGDILPMRFVTFALQAANDVDGAVEFIETYTDARKLSGMAALSGMTFSDAALVQTAVAALEPYTADRSDDLVRLNALIAAFGVLEKQRDHATAQRLIESAAKNPGPQTLFGLARILWSHNAMLERDALHVALTALRNVDPEHQGTIEEIDMGLRRLIGTDNENLALDFLTAKLADPKLPVAKLQSTSHQLTNENMQRLYELVVRWFLSGDPALCENANKLVGIDKDRVFDTTALPLALSPVQKIFLCRKAIGYLFIKPVICCSIIVSVLRAQDREAEEDVSDLLFDPMLLSYGGEARNYLKSIPASDPAYPAVQGALSKVEAFYAGLETTEVIQELHPSEHQRSIIRQREHDEARAIRKLAKGKSLLINLVHQSTVLCGRRSLNYFQDFDGKQQAIEMDLKPFSVSYEFPRREILDPVGLHHMLGVFRVERFK